MKTRTQGNINGNYASEIEKIAMCGTTEVTSLPIMPWVHSQDLASKDNKHEIKEDIHVTYSNNDNDNNSKLMKNISAGLSIQSTVIGVLFKEHDCDSDKVLHAQQLFWDRVGDFVAQLTILDYKFKISMR